MLSEWPFARSARQSTLVPTALPTAAPPIVVLNHGAIEFQVCVCVCE
jgi:hypothetical protein